MHYEITLAQVLEMDCAREGRSGMTRGEINLAAKAGVLYLVTGATDALVTTEDGPEDAVHIYRHFFPGARVESLHLVVEHE